MPILTTILKKNLPEKPEKPNFGQILTLRNQNFDKSWQILLILTNILTNYDKFCQFQQKKL